MADKSMLSSVSNARVFLSYSREDRFFARQLELILRDKGFAPLVDVQAIVAGEPWQDRLENMISQCDTVVFTLTENYLSSPNCSWEIDKAVALGKRMIPVLPGAIPESVAVPDALSRLNYIHFYSDPEIQDSGFYVGIGKLENALRLDLDWLRQKRRYDERAHEWMEEKETGLLLAGVLLEEAEDWQDVVPEGNEVSPEIANFILESRNRENKRIRNARRARSAGWGAAALTAILMAFSGYFYWQQEQAKEETEAARAIITVKEEDNAILASAASDWANAKRQFALSEFERLEEFELVDTAPLEIAFWGMERVEENIDALSEEAVFSHRDTLRAMRRDLAQIQFFSGDDASVQTIDQVITAVRGEIDTFTEQEDPSEDRFADLQFALAEDLLSQTVYACIADDPQAVMISNLSNFPEGLFDNAALTTTLRFAQRNDQLVCNEAREFICNLLDHRLCYSQMVQAAAPNEIAVAEVPVTDEESSSDTIATQPAPPSEPSTERDRVDPQIGNRLPVTGPVRKAIAKGYEIEKIYIHITSDAKRDAAERFAEALREQGYTVPRIELVVSKARIERSVRYYYDVQADQVADEIVAACIDAASDALEIAMEEGAPDPTLKTLSNWESGYDRLISLDGSYGKLPTDRVEIWF